MIGVERVEEYVFWAVTGAIGLLISALTFFVKRGMDKKDARDKEQDKRITEVEDNPQAANEIGSHIYYLADKGYVKCYLGDEVLSLVQDPPREALVRLTAKGIDLMEGTLDDEGVAFGDPMRQ